MGKGWRKGNEECQNEFRDLVINNPLLCCGRTDKLRHWQLFFILGIMTYAWH